MPSDEQKIVGAQFAYIHGEVARFRSRLLSLDPAIRAAAHAELAAKEKLREQRKLDPLASLQQQIGVATIKQRPKLLEIGALHFHKRTERRQAVEDERLARHQAEQQRRGQRLAARKAKAAAKTAAERAKTDENAR